MQATVFGGSGFLGSHVCDALSQNGFIVKIFDKKKSFWVKKNQKMIVGDINDQVSIKKAIQGSEIVYNFAGIADIDECKIKPIETIQQNILGNAKRRSSRRRRRSRRRKTAKKKYTYESPRCK